MRRELGDCPMLAENLGRLAHVLAEMGQATEAARLLSSSEALRERIGSNSTPPVARKNEETLAAIRTTIGDETLAAAWGDGANVRLILIGSGAAFLVVTALIARWASRIKDQLAPQDDLVVVE